MQKRRGISLIVLVITIIVMIVLAGAIILSLNNSGIIQKANQAVRDTDEATVKELAQMAWAEAYADGVRSVEDTEVNGKKVEGFETRVKAALTANGVDTTETSKYVINVTTSGVTIALKSNTWVQDGLKVKRGEEELTIGQSVTYDEGAAYDGGWKVLGADEDGNLLIMSDTDVATVPLGGSTVAAAHESWKSGASEITKAVQDAIPLETAPNAISVRSIEVEDINKITGYDPTTYGSSTVPYQYGNTVTYTYNGTTKPAYTGTNGATGNLTTDHSTNGFYWSDGEKLHHVDASALTNADNAAKEDKTLIDPETSGKAVLTSNYYWYYPTTLTTSSDGEVKGIDTTTPAYIMLFRNKADTANVNYWLASPCVYAHAYDVSFGMRYVYEGRVHFGNLFSSNGFSYTPSRGARAVVTLKSDIPMSSLSE